MLFRSFCISGFGAEAVGEEVPGVGVHCGVADITIEMFRADVKSTPKLIHIEYCVDDKFVPQPQRQH